MNQSLNINEGELSLDDIINFFRNYRKFFLAGVILGFSATVVITTMFAKHTAEAVLINAGAIEFISWKSLQKNLPMLASQISDKKEGTYLKVMSSEKWWDKNVLPTYSLTKKDTKELLGINKDLQDSEGNRILNLVVKANATNKDDSIKNLDTAISFISSGSAYLSYKNLITSYTTRVISSESTNEKNLKDLEIEFGFLEQRAKNLNQLKAQFPSQANSTNQVVDLKDSGAKYLPLSTQIIATNSDINAIKEKILRLKNEQQKFKVMKMFNESALPLINNEFDGIKLGSNLLELSKKFADQIDKNNLNGQLAINTISSELVSIQTRFTHGLEQATAGVVYPPNHFKNILIGIIAGLFASILFALAHLSYKKIKQ
jgi:predicted  nucleic acid-binding Zn-ribbon protein